jgi:hypothetical protein
MLPTFGKNLQNEGNDKYRFLTVVAKIFHQFQFFSTPLYLKKIGKAQKIEISKIQGL